MDLVKMLKILSIIIAYLLTYLLKPSNIQQYFMPTIIFLFIIACHLF